MQKLHLYICSSVFILAQIACTKDKGNYILSDLNTVSISTTDSIFNIEQYDRLSINPTLEQSDKNSKDSYSYEWIAYPALYSETDDAAKLLSTQKDLDTIIPFSPKKYYLQYNVKNNNTGLKSIKRFTVNISAAYNEGWMILSNRDNQGKLSFIRRDGKAFDDPYFDSNNKPLKGKAIASYAFVTGSNKEAYVFTDQEVVKVSANNFAISGAQNTIFSVPPIFRSPFHAVAASGLEQFIINDGKIHATSAFALFGPIGVFSSAFGGESADLFPAVFFGEKPYISVYDNKNKRFLQFGSFGRALSTFSPNSNNAYDLANVGKTMIAADYGHEKTFYTIMKDANNKYYYYGFNPFINNQATSYQEIKNSPSIDQAISFAASASIQHMYYATENAIYLYDILANSARQVYQFPGGTKVKMLSMYKHKGWGATSIVDPDFNKTLVVATNTGTDGSVYFFKIDPTGLFENQTYNRVYTGYGEIAHINYRNKNEQ